MDRIVRIDAENYTIRMKYFVRFMFDVCEVCLTW